MEAAAGGCCRMGEGQIVTAWVVRGFPVEHGLLRPLHWAEDERRCRAGLCMLPDTQDSG